MRHVYACVCLIAAALAALPAFASDPSASDVTVILDFKGPYSRQVRREMQRESTRILRSSGVRLAWTLLRESQGKSYTDLVVLTFNGACKYEQSAPHYQDVGPYAMTKTTDGQILPFGEVECGRVVDSARLAMSGDDFTRADLLIGRALGRVVAHELVHMLTKSPQHSNEGIEKSALSGRQLIASFLPLSALDISRIRLQRAASSLTK